MEGKKRQAVLVTAEIPRYIEANKLDAAFLSPCSIKVQALKD